MRPLPSEMPSFGPGCAIGTSSAPWRRCAICGSVVAVRSGLLRQPDERGADRIAAAGMGEDIVRCDCTLIPCRSASAAAAAAPLPHGIRNPIVPAGGGVRRGRRRVAPHVARLHVS